MINVKSAKIFILLLSLILLVSCNSTKSVSDSNETSSAFTAKSAKDVTKALIDGLSLKDMVKLDSGDISSHYGFDVNLVDDFSAYSCSVEGCADEIAAFKVSKEDDNQKVLTAVREKVELKSDSYKKLNATEYKKFEGNTVNTYGDYIIVTICQSSDSAVQILDKFTK